MNKKSLYNICCKYKNFVIKSSNIHVIFLFIENIIYNIGIIINITKLLSYIKYTDQNIFLPNLKIRNNLTILIRY